MVISQSAVSRSVGRGAGGPQRRTEQLGLVSAERLRRQALEDGQQRPQRAQTQLRVRVGTAAHQLKHRAQTDADQLTAGTERGDGSHNREQGRRRRRLMAQWSTDNP